MSNYLTLAEFKENSYLGDMPVDAYAQLAIDAAEEAIEAYTERRFYQGGTADAYYYTATDTKYLPIDDLVSLVSLKTDDNADGTYETTWAAADSLLAPYNASIIEQPYTRIETNAAVSRTFPLTPKGVEVTGQFGWPAIPDRVKDATLLQAVRFYKRFREAPFGVAGVSLDGSALRLLSRLDADVELMLSRLRRVPVV